MKNWNAINNRLSQQIIRLDLMVDLLESLGSSVRGGKNGYCVRATCPVHEGMHYNLEVKTSGDIVPIHWMCFSRECHKHPRLKPNLLGLVRGSLTKDLDRLPSLDKTQDYIEQFIIQHASRASRGGATPAPEPRAFRASWPRARVRQHLRIPSEYFLARGFEAAILDEFDVGDSLKFANAVLPIYDDSDLCVGWVERLHAPACVICGDVHDPDGFCGLGASRWKFPAGFNKGHWLYGYRQARRSSHGFVLLVEGGPDVLRAAEANVPAVACLGTSLSSVQTQQLAALGKTVLVAYDNDAAGQKAAPLTASQLQAEGVPAVVLHPPEGVKDVGEMTAAQVRRWLSEYYQEASEQPLAV